MGVSDGSFKDRFGMACWILKPKDQAGGIIWCPCVVPGGGESQSAYHSELARLYGMATMICMLCKFYQITEGEVELACDGLQSLKHVSRMEVTTEAKAPQFYLLAATRRVFRKCPVTVKFRHVKGHQDDNFFADLDEWQV